LALEQYPEHAEGIELREMLLKQFTVL